MIRFGDEDKMARRAFDSVATSQFPALPTGMDENSGDHSQ
jgi:hypothetical protein